MEQERDLTRALVELERRLGLGRRVHSSHLFRATVEAWCDLLEWPADVVAHAISLERKHAAHMGRALVNFDKVVRERNKTTGTLARVAKKAGSLVSPGIRADLVDYSDASDEAMSRMEPRDYLLIALAVTSAGYVVYRLTRRSKIDATSPSPHSAPPPESWTLVLVVNAGRFGVVDAIREQGLRGLEGDQLYQATQALWFGRTSDFEISDLAGWFDESKRVVEESEYDVHLIRLDLDEDDRGLHRNSNQMDRLDAFRRFRANGFRAAVSNRLPSDAYGATDVYSR